jgi:hypothetical protein
VSTIDQILHGEINRFLSVDELLDSLSKSHSINRTEAAVILIRLFKKGASKRLDGDIDEYEWIDFQTCSFVDGKRSLPLLDIAGLIDRLVEFAKAETTAWGVLSQEGIAAGDEIDQSAYWSFAAIGFDKSGITEFLKSRGVNIDQPPTSVQKIDSKPRFAPWAQAYSGRKFFSPKQVTMILSGIDPYTSDTFYYQGYEGELTANSDLLAEAIALGSLRPETDQTLAQSELRLWCNQQGRQWPIPPTSTTVVITADSDVVTADLSARITGITKELELAKSELEKANETKKNLNAELSSSVKKVADLSVQIGKLESKLTMNEAAQKANPDVSTDLILGALLAITTRDPLTMSSRQRFANQVAIIEKVEDTFRSIHGLGKSTLEAAFSAANKRLKAAGGKTDV